MTITIDDILLEGVTRVEGSGGWNAPTKRTDRGFSYDSYVESEPLEAQIEAWVNDIELAQLQALREQSEPFPASVDHVVVSTAKLNDVRIEREGRIKSHRKVTIRLSEVRQARLGTAEVSISTPAGDMGSAAASSSPSIAYPEDDDTGTTDETTNSNGIAEFLSDVREGLAGVF